MYRVKIAFSRLTVPQKIQKGTNVASRLDGNPAFPDPHPSLDELRKAVKALEDAHQEALDGGHSRLVFMRNRAKELDDLMTGIAAYVQHRSLGDHDTILSSGLDVRRAPSAPSPTDIPTNVTGSPGSHEGGINLSWSSVPRTKLYVGGIL